jgi:hypothetical protein
MAIIQISKIQVRSGNLVDLPQLDEAEFGWASDAKKLYIGKTTPNENIEILTSYSDIYFSQLVGSYGNLNITTPVTGQTLTFNLASNTWVNTGGNALDPGNPAYYSNTPIHLGNVSNVYIGGGATGYILQTDGVGNLSWTPNGTLYTPIISLTNGAGNVITMNVSYKTPYTNGQLITISGVQGSNTIPVNGKSFYVKLASNFANSSGTGSGNVTLYTDVALTTTANGAGLTATANTGIATAVVLNGGGGAGSAGGSTYSIQYNSGGISTGDSNFQWNYSTQALSLTGTAIVSGNITVGNLNTAGQLVSTISTGTAPIKVNSTTRVANLNVATAGVANTVNDAAQPNITSVGTLTSLSVSGNINGANITGNHYGNGAALSSITGANVTGAVAYATTANSVAGSNVSGQVSNALVAGTVYTSAQPNITSTGTLVSLSVSGKVTAGQLQGDGGNISNIQGANVTGAVAYATTANSVAGGNVSGQVSNALVAGTVYTNAQPNITSTGTLVSLGVSGNANIGNIGTGGLITATGNITGGNFSTTGTGSFGNISVSGNFGGNGNFSAGGNVTAGNLITGGLITATGNITGGNFSTTGTGTFGNISVSGNFGGNGNFSAGGNVTAGNLITGGLITATGNITGANVIGNMYGNGAALSSITGGNVTGQVANALVAGTVYTNAQPNITSVSTSFTNLTFANAQTISGNNLTLTTGANTNVGTITGNWSLSTGSKLQATYADLAEYYEADQDYEPGTVLEFGGDKEVTLAVDGTTRVAGVVTTNPAYVMNTGCQGIAVAIALQGRVPVKVRGHIRKGDMMVSAGNGYARPWNNPQIGMVIGKSLENFEGIEGVIEIAVGRL